MNAYDPSRTYTREDVIQLAAFAAEVAANLSRMANGLSATGTSSLASSQAQAYGLVGLFEEIGDAGK